MSIFYFCSQAFFCSKAIFSTFFCYTTWLPMRFKGIVKGFILTDD